MIFDLISPVSAQSNRTICQQPANEVNHFEGNRYLRWKIQKFLMIFYLVVYIFVVL